MNDDVKMMWKRYIMFLVQCIQRFQHSNPMNNYAFCYLLGNNKIYVILLL